MHRTRLSSCAFLLVLVLNMGTGSNNNGWNISFTPQEVTAVKGVCALISCTFTYPDEANPIEKTLWNVYNDQEKKKEKKSDKGKEKENDKIQMLEPVSNKNCSIIKDIKAKDEGEYEFRVEGKGTYKHTYSPRVKITIQEKPQLDIPTSLREGEQATLICSAPSPCPYTPPEITWWIKIKGGKAINLKDNNITQRITPENLYLSTMTFIPTPELHNATIKCEVYYGNKSISNSSILDVKCCANTSTINKIPSQSGQEPHSAPGENTTVKSNSTHATGIKAFLEKIPTVLAFLAGLASSAVLFSVALCCWVSCYRDETRALLTANTETVVVWEVCQDQERLYQKIYK